MAGAGEALKDPRRTATRCEGEGATGTAPTLVIHGTADPMFPIEHGEALAADIPGARLLTLDGAGHGLYRDDWEMIVATILEHTAAAEGARR